MHGLNALSQGDNKLDIYAPYQVYNATACLACYIMINEKSLQSHLRQVAV